MGLRNVGDCHELVLIFVLHFSENVMDNSANSGHDTQWSTWSLFMAVACALCCLGIIAGVIVLALIPLYLSTNGTDSTIDKSICCPYFLSKNSSNMCR